MVIEVVSHWRALSRKVTQFNLCSSRIGLVLLSRIDFKGCDGNKKTYSVAIGVILVKNEGSVEKSDSIVDGKRLIHFECATGRIC